MSVDLCACQPKPVLPVLLPCPFCGEAAIWEPHPEFGEVVRIACAGGACAVMPRTEYLLTAYVDELRSAWNVRTATGSNAPRR